MQHESEDAWRPGRPTRLRVERLEPRLPLSANVGVEITVGARVPEIDGPETAITGQHDPTSGGAAVASFVDGSHVFVFGGFSAGNASIMARRSLANGQPATPSEFLVAELNPSTSAEIVQLAALPLDDGEFLTLWSTSDGIFASHVDRWDQPVGTRITISPQSNASGTELAAARAGDAVVVAWISFDDGSLRTIHYDLESAAITNPQVIASPDATGSQLFGLSLQTVAPTDLAALWTKIDTRDTQSPAVTHLQPLDAYGIPVGVEATIDDAGFGSGELVQETLALDDGAWVQLIERYGASATQILLQYRNPQGGLIREYDLGVRDSQFGGDASIVRLDRDAGFVVSLVRSAGETAELVTQQFNQLAELIGPPVVVNQNELPNHTMSLVAPLAEGGYVVYWVGSSLDQQSSVVMNRVHRIELQDVHIVWNDPDFVLQSGDYQLRVDGLPPWAGLTNAVYVSTNTWAVPLTNAEQLSLLLPDTTTIVTLQFAIVEGESQATAGVASLVLGTPHDDTLWLTGDTDTAEGTVDGRSGSDTVILGKPLGDYSLVDVTTTGVIRLADTATGRVVKLRNIERLQFADQAVDLTLGEHLMAWLDPNDGVWQPPPELPIGSDDWLDSDLNVVDGLPPQSEKNWYAYESQFAEYVAGSAAMIGANLDNAGSSVFDVMEEYGTTSEYRVGASVMTESRGVNWMSGELSKASSETAYIDRLLERLDVTGYQATSSNSTQGDGSTISMDESELDSADVPSMSAHAVDDIGPQADAVAALESQATANQSRAAADRTNQNHGHANRPAPVDGRRSIGPAARYVQTATLVERHSNGKLPVATRPVLPAPLPSTDAAAAGLADGENTFVGVTIATPANFDIEQLFTEVDTSTSEQVAESVEALQLVAGSAVVVATGFSMANLAWLLRGSVLLSKTLTSLPIWVGFDPLPLLDASARSMTTNSAHGHTHQYDDESLIDIASNLG